MKFKIEIKNRFTGKVLFEFETEENTLKKTLVEACSKGADLQGAYLQGAHLQGLKIKKAQVFTGLYKYSAIPIIDENDKEWIVLGCYTRLVSDWEDNFWNNNSEFPNDGSIKAQLRVMAYETCKKWLDINR